MAPQSGLSITAGKTWILIAVVVAAAVWMWLSNMPPTYPPQTTTTPRVVKVNATAQVQPPPAQQPLQAIGLFMCRGEAYRTRTGIIICGVEMVTDQYIFIRHGWIYATNATQFTLLGDVSVCKFSISVNMLYVDCAQPIMVLK